MENAVETIHNLDFLCKPWDPAQTNLGQRLNIRPDHTYMEFKIGTVTGLWAVDEDHYKILCIINHDPGNGHLTDVLQWFYNSCLRDKKSLVVEEFMNTSFKEHMMEKRGFRRMGESDLIKPYESIQKFNAQPETRNS